ncbi:MarR family transcriptional regulator [Leifsonia sp. Root227]|uniref:MarR family winged helix-turn-helix transcriptional regulator n=1 Tax=unclassified Leifsonia TaxID=2663824 RepID=UPI0006F690AF|nr:MarR family transcriptional regulator [Leifsonia sp. Root227]KRC47296.1 MarR family transcriptional regulator [Leifsonia sp. Root227]
MDEQTVNADEQRPENWPIGRLLGVASRAVERTWAQALEQRGLTHAGLIVLHFLDAGITSQADLARLARVEAQTMSRTVDRLEREGLVTRSPYPGDRRRHALSITDAGREAFAGAKDLERDVFPAVDDPDALRAALVQIVAAVGERG